jgi:CheY-like chemotaxis protein
MTGFDFLVWLRQEPELKDLPVIVLTGSLNPADLDHAYQAGANGFLIKPTGLTEWAAILTKVCGLWLEPETSTSRNLIIKEREHNLPPPRDTGRMAA